MPQVSENAKAITEDFIEYTNLEITEYDSIVKYVQKSLDKLGDVVTMRFIEDAKSSYDDGKIQNPAAALISLIKKEIKHARRKPEEDVPPKKKYITCPNCGNLEASKQTCNRCGWLAPNLIPYVNTTYGTNPKLPPREPTQITVDPELGPTNMKNLLCQVFRIPQNCDEANSILARLQSLHSKTDQMTTTKTVRKLVKDFSTGLVHHPTIYTRIAAKNTVENSKNQ